VAVFEDWVIANILCFQVASEITGQVPDPGGIAVIQTQARAAVFQTATKCIFQLWWWSRICLLAQKERLA